MFRKPFERIKGILRKPKQQQKIGRKVITHEYLESIAQRISKAPSEDVRFNYGIATKLLNLSRLLRATHNFAPDFRLEEKVMIRTREDIIFLDLALQKIEKGELSLETLFEENNVLSLTIAIETLGIISTRKLDIKHYETIENAIKRKYQIIKELKGNKTQEEKLQLLEESVFTGKELKDQFQIIKRDFEVVNEKEREIILSSIITELKKEGLLNEKSVPEITQRYAITIEQIKTRARLEKKALEKPEITPNKGTDAVIMDATTFQLESLQFLQGIEEKIVRHIKDRYNEEQKKQLYEIYLKAQKINKLDHYLSIIKTYYLQAERTIHILESLF